MTYSRHNSQEESADSALKYFSYTSHSIPWPLTDVPSTESTRAPRVHGPANAPERVSAQQALESVHHANEDDNEQPRRRKSSKLRLLANSLPLLRRQGTGDTIASTGNTLDTLSTTVSATSAAHSETEAGSMTEGVSDDAVVAYLARNARKSVNTRLDMQKILK